MKKKLIGIIVCTLMMVATIFSVAGIVNNNENLIENQTQVESEPQYGATSMDDDWPQFQHDAQNIGYSTSRAPQTNHLLWTHETSFMIASSPVVADSKVYIGCENNFFFCFDADNGVGIWQFPIDGSTSASVCAVSNGMVYIPCNYGYVHCLDAENGSKIWTFSPGYGTAFSISSVTVGEDKVYFGTKDRMYCLEADTGDELWNYSISVSKSCPAVYDGKLYFSSYDGKLYCLDANNGSKIWDFITDENFPTSPSLADGKVYTGGVSGFYCLDADNGSKLWDVPVYCVSSPAVANSKVYCSAGIFGESGSFCLDAETGEQIWYSPYGGGSPVFRSPAIADGKLYIGGDEDLYCLDAETGTKMWEYRVTSPPHLSSSPAVAYGRVYMTGHTTGTVYCFEDPSIPPIPPTVNGPLNGIPSLEVKFTINSTDPEGYDVEYFIEWGDNKNSGWIGPFYSGQETTVSHVWSELGTYEIKVKARDKDRLESRSSDPHTITIVDAPFLKIRSISGGLFNVKSVIKNYGSLEATDVNWSITVDGGFILFGRETSGIITNIPLGETTTVNSNAILGFGEIMVTTTATVFDGFSDTREQIGSVFLFFIKIKSSANL